MDLDSIFKKVQFIKDSYKDQVDGYFHPHYYGIKADNSITEESTFPGQLDCERIIMFLEYTYTRVTQGDASFLFCLIKDDVLDDKIEMNGWTMSFDEPIFRIYRTYRRELSIKKGDLKLIISDYPWFFTKNFNLFWKIFLAAQECETQLELDLLKELYKKEKENKDINLENFKLRAENEWKNEYLKANQEFIKSSQEHFQNMLEKAESLLNDCSDSSEISNLRQQIKDLSDENEKLKHEISDLRKERN